MKTSPTHNVILISLDCVRPGSLGCYGSKEIRTPFIDAIAGKGIRFDQAISQAPFTPASHASVFTGLNPNRHGIRYMIGQKLLPVPTLAEILHSAGWSTGAFVGSSALSREYGLDRGFSTYNDKFENEETNWILGFRRDCVESTSRALEWIENQKRFFLFLHYFDAHAYDGEPVSEETQKRGLEAIDPQIGRLLDHLKEKNLLENTVIAIFADHGDSISEHGENGHLERLFDTTLRVPLILRLPGGSQGTVVTRQVRLIDLLPTFVDVLHLAPLLPAGNSFDGVSLLPLVTGPVNTVSQPAFSETCMEAGQKRDKMETTRYFSIRTEQTKLIYEKVSNSWEAYDVSNDPSETSNIWDGGESFSDLVGGLNEYIRQGEKLEQVRMMSGEEDDVRRSLEALGYVESRPEEPSGEMAFYAALDEGKRFINLGKPGDAVAVIMKALEMPGIENKLKANGRMCLAEAYRKLGDTRSAGESLRMVLNGGPDPFLAARATIALSGIAAESDTSKAIEILTTFLESGNSSTPEIRALVRARRAALLRECHKQDEAVAEYEAVLAESPQNIDAYYNLGSTLKSMGHYVRAQSCFQKVLKIATPLTDKYHGGAKYHLADISLKRSLHQGLEKSPR